MKKNLIKTILSLGVLTLFAMSGMASADPTTYDVTIGNLNGYGVLNLGRLIMRNSAGNPGIVLDGGFGGVNTDYVIKIGENAGSDSLSKIRVSNICKRDGTDCKSIADLTTGVTINGTNGLICVKVNDKEINCNKTVINNNPTLTWGEQKTIGTVGGTGLTVMMPANPHIEGTNIVGTSENATTNANTTNTTTYLNHVENNITTSSTQIQGEGGTTVSANGGNITITSKDTKGRTVVSTQNTSSASSTNNTNTYLNYVDDRNGTPAVVNGIKIQGDGLTAVSSDGNTITISSWEGPGNEVHYTGRNVLGNSSTINNGVVTTSNTNTYLNHVEGSTVQNSLQIKGSGATSVASSNGVLTISSTDNNTTYSAATSSTLGLVKLGSDTQQTQAANAVSSTAGKTYAIQKNSAGQLVVNVPRLDNNTTYTAGNGLILSSSQFAAKLKNTTKSAYAATNNIGNVSDANKLYAVGMDQDGYLAVHVPWTASTSSNSYWKTVTFNNGVDNVTGLEIDTTRGGPSNLYFENGNTIYHGGTLKFQRAGFAVASAPIEFNAKGAKFGNLDKARILDIAGVSIAGKLVVGNNGTKSNWINIYATGDNYENGNGRHGEIRASNELAVGIIDGAFIYFKNIPNASNNDLLKYRVGINTNSPATTLDVAGSIRVQDNPCVPNPCNASTVGSITFINNKFYGCKKKSPNTYRWYEFTMEDSDSNELVSSLVCQQQAAY